MAILSTENLSKSFEGITAVNDVSFDIQAGQIIGIIGPNGAGKTSLLNLLSGFYEADEGDVLFKDRNITTMKPHERAQLGMIRTFQITRDLSGMTVLDNMLLGYPDSKYNSVLRQLVQGPDIDEEALESAKYLLRELDLWDSHEEYAGNLSGGQQKLLELGRAIICDPDLLLLDEPVAGVNPELTDEICEELARLRDDGMTFIVIEHDMDVVMELSDEVIVLREGSILTTGTPEEVQRHEEVLETYIGHSQ